MGGDSILSLRIVARARQAGLHLTTRQLFQHQTVAALAEVAGRSTEAAGSPGGARAGAADPHPGWFFEQNFTEAQHWNQAVMMATDEPLEGAALEAAVSRVMAQHDALGMRFERGPEGWRQVTGEAPVGVLERVDLQEVPESELRAAIEREAERAQAGLALEQGS